MPNRHLCPVGHRRDVVLVQDSARTQVDKAWVDIGSEAGSSRQDLAHCFYSSFVAQPVEIVATLVLAEVSFFVRAAHVHAPDGWLQWGSTPLSRKASRSLRIEYHLNGTSRRSIARFFRLRNIHLIGIENSSTAAFSLAGYQRS